MKTTIDWLTFRCKSDPQNVLEALKPMFGDIGQHLRLKALERGNLGFERAATVGLADMPVARIDFGGESQRGWARVAITGKQCEWVSDWDALEGVEALPGSEPRRLDIALTTWDGQVNHDMVVDAYSRGRFLTGGAAPALRQITSSDPEAGKTCYVGKRESDKFFRAYEKGFEMVAKTRGLPGKCLAIDGKAVENIYRCEVELKSKTTPMSWDVLARRDQFFAGSYPFCADLLPGIEADILMRRKERAPQADLALALENCRIQFGPTLYTALTAYQGDIMAVWDKVIGRSHSQPLLEAGVLLVDHE